MWKVVRAPCRADSDREAGRAPTGPLGDRGNPRGMPPTFPSKSHLQSLHHHPLPAAVHLTVKTTAPVVSQAPYLLLDLRIFPTSFSYPSNASAPSPCTQELYSFCTSFCSQGSSAVLEKRASADKKNCCQKHFFAAIWIEMPEIFSNVPVQHERTVWLKITAGTTGAS